MTAYSTLETLCDAMQQAGAGVSGVNCAPDKPPETPFAFPFLVTFPEAFQFHPDCDKLLTFTYDIVQQLHVARQFLPNDIDRAYPFAESIPKAVYTILRTAGQSVQVSRGQWGPMAWGYEDENGNPTEIQTIGFTWIWSGVKVQFDYTT